MTWATFHHPDFSFPVVRRRVGIEIMEMLEMTSIFMTRGGWAVLNKSCYPNQAAYLNAASRLKKRGLLVKRSEGGKTPVLFLTETGQDMLPDYFAPEKFWNQKWNGIWYMLIYDVPEVDRKYRNALRQFLRRMRMGCLQQSVWVTPRDIRPDFDDLSTAANIDAFSYLLEARTVLGLPSRRVVEDAWNCDRLYSLQERYLKVMRVNLESLKEKSCNAGELSTLTRVAMDAYHGAFMEDPLLPTALLPSAYLGKQVLSLHRTLFELIEEQILNLSSG